MASDPTANVAEIASAFMDAARVALRQRVFEADIEAETARIALGNLDPQQFEAVARLHATLSHAGARIFATPVVPHGSRLIPTIHFAASGSGRLGVEHLLEWAEIAPWHTTPARDGSYATRLEHRSSDQEVWLFQYTWYFAPPAREAA